MGSSCPSALASLDDSLAVAYEGLRKLEAAESVDVAEVIRQLKSAVKSAQKLRSLVSSEQPDASWTNREELNALIDASEKSPATSRKWYELLLGRVNRS